MSQKIFIIAGEASGDLHGKNLVKALFQEDSNIEIKAYGGDQMESAGAQIVRNYEAFAFMGFYEVAKNLRTVLNNIKATENLIEAYNPDILVFIDFPGFNLRIAKRLKTKLKNTKFVYYIAPQVWAWKSRRVHDLNKLMDKICVILPFEKNFFKKFNYHVDYVGHPLMDELENFTSLEKEDHLIAILPGSRKQEIQKMLPLFAQVAREFPQKRFEISKMDKIPTSFYNDLLDGIPLQNLSISQKSTYELLSKASSAIVTSGTATLETALLNTPQIVAYKTSKLSYWIAKRIVDINYISLVNLILNKEVVTELIQDDLNVKNLVSEIKKMESSLYRDAMTTEYAKMKSKLGQGSSSKVASLILNEV